MPPFDAPRARRAARTPSGAMRSSMAEAAPGSRRRPPGRPVISRLRAWQVGQAPPTTDGCGRVSDTPGPACGRSSVPEELPTRIIAIAHAAVPGIRISTPYQFSPAAIRSVGASVVEPSACNVLRLPTRQKIRRPPARREFRPPLPLVDVLLTRPLTRSVHQLRPDDHERCYQPPCSRLPRTPQTEPRR